jgi:hypothetical protein
VTEPNVEFIGVAPAMADMKRWSAALGPEVDKAVAPLGTRVAGIVAGRVPHLTGQLAGSVESSTDDEGVAVSLGDGVDYAGWIEFGGSRGRDYVPEGRYLYPTLLEAEDEFAQIAGNAADDSVGRFAWSTPAS